MMGIGTMVAAAVGVVALLVIGVVARASDETDLGSVSEHWIADHRVDPR
jgi:hypothetical protein